MERGWFKEDPTCKVHIRAELTRLLEPRTFHYKPQLLDVNHKAWHLPDEFMVLFWSKFYCYVPIPLFWIGKFTLYVSI